MRQLNETALHGEILAYQGKYKEAASHFVKNNLVDKAVNMYSVLKKFQEANELVKKAGGSIGGPKGIPKDILMKQIEYERDRGNWKGAADLAQTGGLYKEAIEIYGKRGYLDNVMEVCRQLDKNKSRAEIELCAKYFRSHGHHTFAKQAYLLLDDIKALMALHVEFNKWDEAFMLGKRHTHLEPMIWLPYADWLSANDRFDEA